MKQVVLRIEDSAFENFKAMLCLCPAIEMVDEYSDLEVRRQLDICIEEAIRELRKGKVFRKPSDYTYIMQVINDRQVKEQLGLDGLPGRSTLYDTRKMMSGEYPNWVFNDPQVDVVETLRRNNVARQFLSALFKAQRALSDSISDKS